jgi:hypothetical protein
MVPLLGMVVVFCAVIGGFCSALQRVSLTGEAWRYANW